MRDPYRARPDYQRYGAIAVGVIALLLAALIAVYLLRPAVSSQDRRDLAALSAQMDAAEAASDGRAGARRAEQVRQMQ